MDRGAWQATVHSIAKSWTWPKWLSTHTHLPIKSKKWEGWGRGGLRRRHESIVSFPQASFTFGCFWIISFYNKLGFPGGSDGKASACNVGDLRSIPGLERSPWRMKWQPTPVLLPGKFHGWRRLVGYGPWNCRVGHDWTTSLVHNKLVIW